MKVLVFTGAGASVELGVPAMTAMAHDLHGHMRHQGVKEEVFSRFDAMLANVDYDAERLIEAIDAVETGEREKETLGFAFDRELLETVRLMRWECEWFIHQVCERVRELEASALWRPVLLRGQEHELCFVTTNYDRAIEFACKSADVRFSDGFSEFDGREYAEWTGISTDARVKVLKIHGSTDWYQGVDGAVYKIKHPIPLYGELSLSSQDSGMPSMKSAMVLPTREKKVNQPPYPDLVADFRNAARSVEVALFVGTSLRDPDILDIFHQCRRRIPTYIVGMGLESEVHECIDQDKMIVQTTSEFVISSFPRFLKEANIRYLDELVNETRKEPKSILPSIIMASQKEESSRRICEAIEELAEHDVSVDLEFLKPLLMHEEPMVRNYALSIVPKSLDRHEGLALAEKLAGESPGGSFAEEFKMLREMTRVEQEECSGVSSS